MGKDHRNWSSLSEGEKMNHESWYYRAVSFYSRNRTCKFCVKDLFVLLPYLLLVVFEQALAQVAHLLQCERGLVLPWGTYETHQIRSAIKTLNNEVTDSSPSKNRCSARCRFTALLSGPSSLQGPTGSRSSNVVPLWRRRRVSSVSPSQENWSQLQRGDSLPSGL